MPDPDAETTVHVREALRGDERGLAWIVGHFSPLLLAEARYRIARGLRGLYEPEDLVQQTWLIALPRLGDVVARDGRSTPVLIRFLSAILLQHYRNLIVKHRARRPLVLDGDGGDGSADIATLPAETTGVVSRACRSELSLTMTRLLDSLPDTDREILILKGIEQLPYAIIAGRLDVPEGALRVRFHRALARLRDGFPPCIVDELLTE